MSYLLFGFCAVRIIGHRGSAGNELENTLASIQHAVHLDVWAIEFDVRKTKDGKLVIFHDAELKRLSASRTENIKDMTAKQLQSVPLLSGSHIPTLEEALDVMGSKKAFIEVKDSGCAKELVDVLAKFPKADVTVASFKLDELSKLKKIAPKLRLYGLERTKPFDIIHFAKQRKLQGVGLNYWILNPLTYFLCKRAGLEMYVFTIDSPFLARFVSMFYPEAVICTNYPERFVKS
jgi:glycerophosphoryl diester phosphodiesterase